MKVVKFLFSLFLVVSFAVIGFSSVAQADQACFSTADTGEGVYRVYLTGNQNGVNMGSVCNDAGYSTADFPSGASDSAFNWICEPGAKPITFEMVQANCDQALGLGYTATVSPPGGRNNWGCDQLLSGPQESC